MLLVLDAAYAEYVNRNDYEPGFELVSAGENTIMTRTFSKIFGLAAARVGWAYAPLAVAAGDEPHPQPVQSGRAVDGGGGGGARKTRRISRTPRRITRSGATGSRMSCARSATMCPRAAANFVLIPFGAEPGRTAPDADEYLVFSEAPSSCASSPSYKLPRALRMTIGLEHENRAVLDALREFNCQDAL